MAEGAGGAGGATGFLGGREKARVAGYPSGWLNTLPLRVAECYRGCGFLLEQVDLSGVQSVVDLGCGAGIDVRLIAERMDAGGRVIALDLTPEMLRLVDRSAGACSRITVLPLAGDMESLPLADNTTDIVMANASFNLTVDKSIAAAEAFRILRPGGRLIFRELVLEGQLPPELHEDPMAGNTSLGGVLPERELLEAIGEAGFIDTHVSHHKSFSYVTAIRLEANKPT